MYSQIDLHVTLSCPTGGCDIWDRFANVSVYHDSDWFEIGRYITPYGKACGWRIDVTDYRSMLKDTVIIKSFIDTWTNPGWLVKLDFEFKAGIALYENIKVENLWHNENLIYGDANNPSILPVVTKSIDVNAQIVKFKLFNTGHGQGNTDNAAEFSQKTHSLYVNAALANSHFMWRTDCATNPCSPQGGSWQYNRAGWCPGADVLPVYFDLTTLTAPGQNVDLDYRLQSYSNACSPNYPNCVSGITCTDCNYNYNGHTQPHYKVSAQLISYLSGGSGVNTLLMNDRLIISPNPSSGLIQLKLKGSAQQGQFEIFDVLGNSVYKNQMTQAIQLFDISALSKGTYILKYFSDEITSTKRIVLE